ncbi:hypothetical protein FIBSPDRAFT_934997 [Athelia psychrophila]|uniref:Uncharacterized protein n=1 Tax=Athelia psychrophila TaxID=1759441 RepID=A0A166EEN9_9AGAM|nr:hypothetical protein FIBSPDRAFT_934997 [Fibularhizoctonia sp. CBS 109695]
MIHYVEWELAYWHGHSHTSTGTRILAQTLVRAYSARARARHNWHGQLLQAAGARLIELAGTSESAGSLLGSRAREREGTGTGSIFIQYLLTSRRGTESTFPSCQHELEHSLLPLSNQQGHGADPPKVGRHEWPNFAYFSRRSTRADDIKTWA